MFEAVEIGRHLSKEVYDATLPVLRTGLLKAQTALESSRFPVIVLINGLGSAEKADTLNVFYEWLDARYLTTYAEGAPSEAERERPLYWRYWMALPPAGRIALFLGDWYTTPIREHARGKIDDGELALALQRARAFERTLADDGALFVKLWFHLSKKQQRRRLEELSSSKQTRWRVTEQDWKDCDRYDRVLATAEQVVRETSSGFAPWTLIEAADDRYRNVTAAKQLLTELERRLSGEKPRAEPRPEPSISDPVTIFDTLDLGKKLDKAEYEEKVPLLQARLNKLSRRLAKKRQNAIFVFEGPDAAGKGGAIRRVVRALDARQYRIIPVSAPTEEERAHHYLWRFYRHLPARGRITIYDRSWYGRVLVERVEGFASEPEWRRAYGELNEFESELVEDGIILVKFWLQISEEEQLRRFQKREAEPWKQHKITAEDYRNREKAPQYEAAAAEMVTRCSTSYAPFVLVEANDKRYARVKVLETLCERLEEALD